MMRRMRGWGAAAVLLGLAAPAFADDFVALCKAVEQDPEAERLCACAADKVAHAERSAAIAAMRAVADALAKGKPIDPSTLPPDLSSGLSAVKEAEATCR
ncbi:MAG: hypothetical protein ACHQRJ_07270 [Alphaproteobacteria bacterium]